jgi:hypothetical protein
MNGVLMNSMSVSDRIEFPRSFQLVVCAILTEAAGIVLNRRMIGTLIAVLLFIIAISNVRAQSKQSHGNTDKTRSPFDK